MAKQELITLEAKQEFANPILNANTKRIINAIMAQTVAEEESKFEKARAIGEMVVGGVDFEAEGFANLEDYASRLFGWQKSTAYAYRSVGIGLVRGLLPERDANGIRFSFSALHEMCNLPDSGLRAKMVENGEINATDTTAKIRETVKATKPKKATKRTEKQYSFFSTLDKEKPVEVCTEESFRKLFGKDLFHEWTEEKSKYYLVLTPEGKALVFYRSSLKVVDAK